MNYMTYKYKDTLIYLVIPLKNTIKAQLIFFNLSYKKNTKQSREL